jgi:uncharacterized protein
MQKQIQFENQQDVSGEVLDKYERLCEQFQSVSSLIVAFSGGVDSSLLAYAAHRELGEEMLAITAASETYPTEELREAEQIADQYDFRHRVVPTSELAIEGYSENSPDRCFLCRDGLFTMLHEIAEAEGFSAIAYGENASDGAGMDYRPGQAAAKKHDVLAPLDAADLDKDDVRQLSQALGLPNWDKPELACLSSRFPYGTEITEDGLEMVEKAERFLRENGFRQVRVRHHGEVARIEVLPAKIDEFFDEDLRERVVEHLQEVGYTYVSVDLRGYKTGSMNEALDDE